MHKFLLRSRLCLYASETAGVRSTNSVDPAGFVRLAAQQGASLVPVLAFGELDTLRNFVDLPAVQVCPEFPMTEGLMSLLPFFISWHKIDAPAWVSGFAFGCALQ